jgi:hypothetical protein
VLQITLKIRGLLQRREVRVLRLRYRTTH